MGMDGPSSLSKYELRERVSYDQVNSLSPAFGAAATCACCFAAALEVHDHRRGPPHEEPSLQAYADPQHLLHCTQPSPAHRHTLAGLVKCLL